MASGQQPGESTDEAGTSIKVCWVTDAENRRIMVATSVTHAGEPERATVTASKAAIDEFGSHARAAFTLGAWKGIDGQADLDSYAEKLVRSKDDDGFGAPLWMVDAIRANFQAGVAWRQSFRRAWTRPEDLK